MDDSRSPELRFCVLGPVRAWSGDVELDLGSPQQRATLAVLLLRDGGAVTVEELVDAVWDSEPPRAAIGVIRTYVYRLRQVLPTGVIVSAAGGYRVPVDAGELDLTVFQIRLAAAGQRDLSPARAWAVLTGALQMWDGTPLAGLPGAFAGAHRSRLEDLRLAARERLLALEVELGQYPEAVAGLSALLAERPLRERPRQLLMLALYRSGQQAEALAVFQDGRKALARERGISPGRELVDLHRRILAADPGLLPSVERRRPRREPFRSGPIPAQLPLDQPDFTGRTAVLDRLTRALTQSSDQNLVPGPSQIIGLHGPAGIGKSALAVRIGHRLRTAFPAGQVYLDLTGPEQSWPASAVLGALLRAAGVPDREQPAELADRVRRWQQVLADRRLLVVLDQVQSPAQITAALPVGPGSPTGAGSGSAVIITSRQPFPELPQVHWQRLEGLPVPDGLTLLARIAGPNRVQADLAASRRLLDDCDHRPRSIRAAAARLASRPAWSVAALATGAHLAAGLR